MKNHTLYPIVGLLLLSFSACNTAQEETQTAQTTQAEPIPAVAPPFAAVEVPFESFTFYPTEEQELVMEQGTTIRIPADAFVTEDGKAVTEQVSLRYREYHTMGEIISSGIKMTYEEGGETYDFESAGMFEILAEANGQPLKIAEGQALEVTVPSEKAGDEFGFYTLDEDQGDWIQQTASVPAVQITKTQPKEGLPELAELPLVPIVPKAYDPGKYTFDLDVNYQALPELQVFHGIMWQYAGVAGSKEDPKLQGDLDQVDWNKIELSQSSEEGTYKLDLKFQKREFSTTVIPVLNGKALENAQEFYAEALAEYERVKTKRENHLKQLQTWQEEITAGGYVRTGLVSNLGICNFDQMKRFNRIRLAADFDFGTDNINLLATSVYIVVGRGELAVSCPFTQWTNYPFYLDVPKKMVAVLPDNRVATFSAADFKTMEQEMKRTRKLNAVTFEMTVHPTPLKTPGELDALLATL